MSYIEIAENISKHNKSIGLDAENIRKNAIIKYKKVANRYGEVIFRKVGQWHVAYSDDYKAILGLLNASKDLARQSTADIKNGMSYGIPNCVTNILDHEKWVTNGMAYKSKTIEKAVMSGVRRYCIVWGQGVQNNFLEYFKGYNQIHTQAQKHKLYRYTEGV